MRGAVGSKDWPTLFASSVCLLAGWLVPLFAGWYPCLLAGTPVCWLVFWLVTICCGCNELSGPGLGWTSPSPSLAQVGSLNPR